MATFRTPDQANPTPISDVPWPKRANKACCNCRSVDLSTSLCSSFLLLTGSLTHSLVSPSRRDKIKCDGGRPCAGRKHKLSDPAKFSVSDTFYRIPPIFSPLSVLLVQPAFDEAYRTTSALMGVHRVVDRVRGVMGQILAPAA